MKSEIIWHNQIISIFPEKLKKYVKFVFSPRKETHYNGILGSHYEKVPNEKYDFIVNLFVFQEIICLQRGLDGILDLLFARKRTA